MNLSFERKTLGSVKKAFQVAQRAQQVVPAYQHFLSRQEVNPGEAFEQLPQSDKESYALAYPFKELLGNDSEDILAIYSSSGSSGKPFYWPQLKSSSRFVPLAIQKFLEGTFAVDKKKTLAIVGLSLGSWMGGEYFAWSLKTMALDAAYPFWVFSPGNHHDEIIQIIGRLESLAEQIVLFMVPSAISHFYLKANQLNQSLPFHKLKYVVTGEPFPESLRGFLQHRSEVADGLPFMFSFYGSSDTGLLGRESLASIALRKLLCRNHTLAKALGIESPIPHFFHFTAIDAFLEAVDGHLCVTRWQGIPLVRYVLYDRVAFYHWKELKKAILNSELLEPEDEIWVKTLTSSSNAFPDLLAVTGRADSSVILNGTNLTEYMLDESIKCKELQEVLTGLYYARVIYEEERQYLALNLEIRQECQPNESVTDRVYQSLIGNLGRLQPEFLDDWRNIYQSWDSDPTRRILRLNLVPWPGLSQAIGTSIKHRGIVNDTGE